MKYLKTYEGKYLSYFYFNKKAKKYKKYEDKYLYIHFNPTDTKFIIKLLEIQYNYFIKCKIYDWDEHYNAFSESESDSLHIDDIEVIESFDSINDANNFIKDINKYNI